MQRGFELISSTSPLALSVEGSLPYSTVGRSIVLELIVYQTDQTVSSVIVEDERFRGASLIIREQDLGLSEKEVMKILTSVRFMMDLQKIEV